MTVLKKTLTALAAAATLMVAAVAVPQESQAAWRGGGWHGGWRGGAFLGGLAAGALVGGALAGPAYYGYYGGPYYGPYAYGGCWRERVWTPFGWRWHRVCY